MPLTNHQDTNTEWATYKSISYHLGLLQKGIVAVLPTSNKEETLEDKKVDAEHFSINDREFYFGVFCSNDNKEKKLNSGKEENSNNKDKARNCRRTYSLLKQLASYTKVIELPTTIPVIYNQRHREEAFIPFSFDTAKKTALYIYPWLSQNSAFKFSGFERFGTVGCLLGSSLCAMDQLGTTFPIMKHDIKFFEQQRIVTIVVDAEENSPYEKMLLAQFKQYAYFIDNFVAKDEEGKNKAKELLYHLPYCDYILFGIGLYIKNRITSAALKRLVEVILEGKKRHEILIGKICEEHAINIVFESPFENLFRTKSDEVVSVPLVMNKIKEIENILSEMKPDLSPELKEENMVKVLMEKLIANDYHVLQQKLWREFIKVSDISTLKSIESLFKIANAVMVASASYDRTTHSKKPPYSVCSILPLSEKQIQIGYVNFCKKINSNLEEKDRYPAIVNITTLDNLVTYSPSTKGLPFYFVHCLENLSKFITKAKILEKAYQQIGCFFSEPAKDLNKFIESPGANVALPKNC